MNGGNCVRDFITLPNPPYLKGGGGLDFLFKICNNIMFVRIVGQRRAHPEDGSSGRRPMSQNWGLLERQRRNAMAKASQRQGAKLLQLVDKTGWRRDEIQRRIIGRWRILRDIAEALDTGRVTEEHLRRAIFQSLLAACQQNLVKPDFNEEHYPLEPVTLDEHDWEVAEYHFKDVISDEQAFAELKAMGYRFCGVRRAMEFIAVHPDLQLDHPLVVTARWQSPDGHWYVPIFHRAREVGRYLYLDDLPRDFDPNFGWLVLRRKSAA